MNRTIKVICYLALFAVAGCSDFATREPSEADLLGEYVPTDEMLERLKKEGYPMREISIVLGAQHTLEFHSIPDCWLTDFGEPHHGFDSGSGFWKTEKQQAVWGLYFQVDRFKADSSYSRGGGLGLNNVVTVTHNHPPYGLAISVAAGDSGYLQFRRR